MTRPGRRSVPTLDPDAQEAERGERALSDQESTGPDAGEDTGEDDAVLLFVGGPLDGRVEFRAARHGEPPQTVTHVHLHDGPKIVHLYDLHEVAGHGGEYRLREA